MNYRLHKMVFMHFLHPVWPFYCTFRTLYSIKMAVDWTALPVLLFVKVKGYRGLNFRRFSGIDPLHKTTFPRFSHLSHHVPIPIYI